MRGSSATPKALTVVTRSVTIKKEAPIACGCAVRVRGRGQGGLQSYLASAPQRSSRQRGPWRYLERPPKRANRANRRVTGRKQLAFCGAGADYAA